MREQDRLCQHPCNGDAAFCAARGQRRPCPGPRGSYPQGQMRLNAGDCVKRCRVARKGLRGKAGPRGRILAWVTLAFSSSAAASSWQKQQQRVLPSGSLMLLMLPADPSDQPGSRAAAALVSEHRNSYRHPPHPESF